MSVANGIAVQAASGASPKNRRHVVAMAQGNLPPCWLDGHLTRQCAVVLSVKPLDDYVEVPVELIVGRTLVQEAARRRGGSMGEEQDVLPAGVRSHVSVSLRALGKLLDEATQ